MDTSCITTLLFDSCSKKDSTDLPAELSLLGVDA